MISTIRRFVFLGVLSLALAPHAAQAASITLSPAFKNIPVLQRGLRATVWGTSDGVASVRAVVEDTRGRVVAQAPTAAVENGRWRVSFLIPEVEAGQRVLKVFGDQQMLVNSSILVGEVWFCSGQSNMSWPVSSSDVSIVSDPSIRLLRVPRETAASPELDLPASALWFNAGPGVDQFSATCYSMAKKMRESLNVPVGVILAAYGGTIIEEWIPNTEIKPYPVAIGTRSVGYGALYNKMIHPLAGYGFRGLVWLQGETNIRIEPTGSPTVRALRYFALLPSLIGSWRAAWEAKGATLPNVLIMQIGAFGCPNVSQEFSEIREAQRLAQLLIPFSTLVPTFDLADLKPSEACTAGFEADIHSRYKTAVGSRAAAMAMGAVYKKAGHSFESPVLASYRLAGKRAVLSFRSSGPLRASTDKMERSIEVCCDAKGAYRFAESIAMDLPNRLLTVQAPVEVPSIKSVRYAYDSIVLGPETVLPAEFSAQSEYRQAFLYDAFGLPIAPFSTDLMWRDRSAKMRTISDVYAPLISYQLNGNELSGYACYSRTTFPASVRVVSKATQKVYLTQRAGRPSDPATLPAACSQEIVGVPNRNFLITLTDAVAEEVRNGQADVIVVPLPK